MAGCEKVDDRAIFDLAGPVVDHRGELIARPISLKVAARRPAAFLRDEALQQGLNDNQSHQPAAARREGHALDRFDAAVSSLKRQVRMKTRRTLDA